MVVVFLRIFLFIIFIVGPSFEGHTADQAFLDFENTAKNTSLKNAAIIVYGWSKKDQQMKILLARKTSGLWTVPGGGIKSSQDARSAAVAELYEETAAFEIFNPAIILPLINQLGAARKFGYPNNEKARVAIYILNIGDDIDAYDIASNWRIRAAGCHDYMEMDEWKWVSVQQFKYHFDSHKNDKTGKATEVAFDTMRMDGACYRSLQHFAKRKFNFDTLLEEKKKKKSLVTITPFSKPISKPSKQTSNETLSSGVLALQDELVGGKQNSAEMYQLLSGYYKPENILPRGPNMNELHIIIQAIKKIVQSDNMLEQLDIFQDERFFSGAYKDHLLVLNGVLGLLRGTATLEKIPSYVQGKVNLIVQYANRVG